MPRTETVLNVFVASPDELGDERVRLNEVVDELNRTWRQNLGISLELISSETHAYPGVGTDAQAVINDQIGENYDIFIGVMWKRFGTPTGRAGSGTVEEFDRAYERFQENPDQVRVMFYFKNAPVELSEIDPEQLALINHFRKRLGEEGVLYWSYRDSDEFTNLVRMHLSRQVQEWKKSWGTETAREVSTNENDMTESVSSGSEEDFSLDEEEVGLLDLILQGLDGFENAGQSAEHMTKEILILGHKIEAQTAKLDTIQRPSQREDFKKLKHIIEDVSREMELFNENLKKEIPIFSESYSKGISALSRATSLSSEFGAENEQDISEALNVIVEVKEGLRAALEGTKSFKVEVKALPPASTKLNKAKRNTLSVLANLISELQTAINLTDEVETIIQGMISDSRVS